MKKINKINNNLEKAWEEALLYYKKELETLAIKYKLGIICGNGLFCFNIPENWNFGISFSLDNFPDLQGMQNIDLNFKNFTNELSDLAGEIKKTTKKISSQFDTTLFISWTDAFIKKPNIHG